MTLAYFLSDDAGVRAAIEKNADGLMRAHRVDFVCAVDCSWRPAGPYTARASDDLLLVIERVGITGMRC